MSQLGQLNVKTNLDYNYNEIGVEYKPIIIEEAQKLMITLPKNQI